MRRIPRQARFPVMGLRERPGAARIVHAGPDDVAVLHGMIDLFSRVFEDPASYDTARPDDAYLRRLLASDGFIALAAVRNGAVVGALAAYVMHKFEQARS
jgi:aminoglycoside 3-N-acetyltransferase I